MGHDKVTKIKQKKTGCRPDNKYYKAGTQGVQQDSGVGRGRDRYGDAFKETKAETVCNELSEARQHEQ